MPVKASNRYETAIVALTKAEKRLSVLPILLREKNYAEILRETNAIAELSLKGIMSHVGATPEDDTPLLSAMKESLKTMPDVIQKNFRRIVKVSGTIQKQHTRLSGSQDATKKEASDAMNWGGFLVRMAQGVIKEIDD